MNWNVIEGKWKQLVGKSKTKWGKLTDDHMILIAGMRAELAGRIQEANGVFEYEADRQVKDFKRMLKL